MTVQGHGNGEHFKSVLGWVETVMKDILSLDNT